MDSGTPAPTTAEIEAVAEVFFNAGLMVGETAARRAKAAWFCDHHGRVEDAELLAAYAERESDDSRRPGGLLYHILQDGTRTKEAIRYMRRKMDGTQVRRRGPAMDLPDSDARRAQAAGYQDTDEWHRSRSRAVAWERWQFDRRHLPYEVRLAAVAEEFGWDPEDAYDLLSEAVRQHYRDVIENASDRLQKLAELPSAIVSRHQQEALRTKLRALLAATEKEAAEVTSLEAWEDRVQKRRRRKPRKEDERPEDFGSMVRRMGLAAASEKRRGEADQ